VTGRRRARSPARGDDRGGGTRRGCWSPSPTG